MPILDLQQRSRELGRIRIGEVKATSNGKTRPAKLDRFRLTSPSKPLLEQVAQLYGGQVAEWQPQGGGPKQWEVVTTATRLPVLVPPQPVTQFYEHWLSGGCKRRCDGVTELLADKPCICGPDPADRLCKPTTRLNVVLRDVPGVGVWRLESHGYYAAVELPQAAMFLAQAGGYVNGFLALEPRRVKREIAGKTETRDFMVPTLEIDITPAQLLAGKGGITPAAMENRAAPAAIEATRAALEAGPAVEAPSRPDYVADARVAADLDAVKAVWARAKAAGHLDDDEDLQNALIAIGTEKAGPPPPAADPPQGEDPDEVWSLIVAACPETWSMDDLERDFAQANGGTMPGSADPGELRAYLEQLKARGTAVAS